MDNKIQSILREELERQQNTIELIASENHVSPAVLQTLGSVFTNKYAEGYPGARYYAGNVVADELENYVRDLALETFSLDKEKWHVNVQAYSGSPANLAIYNALLEIGDTILALPLSHGAHLTHGHKVSFTGQAYNVVNYHVKKETGYIDYEEMEAVAKKTAPKIIIVGGTAIPREIDYGRVVDIAKQMGAKVMVDASHYIGLVAGKAIKSPFDFDIDVLMCTTHKTLRGPRAAMIFTKKEYATAIDKAVFPGLQGGPHLNAVAGIGQALCEAKTPAFEEYSQKVVENAKTLGEALVARGYKLVSGGTDTHLLLVDLTEKNISGKPAQELLEKTGIIINMNTVPFDERKPTDPSGIRLGTAAITTRGMGVAEMETIAQLIDDILMERMEISAAREDVLGLCREFPIPGYPTS